MSEDLDAQTRLQHAVAALTSTTPHVLHRDDDQARRDVDQAHLDHIRYLRKRLTMARDNVDVSRIMCAMRTAGERHRERRAGLRAQLTSTPSLIEQLLDAVHSASGHGNGSRGVHRSPLNTAAVELVRDIARTIGCRDFAQHGIACLLDWAGDLDGQDPEIAERWLVDARAILDPPRRGEAKAACPICHTRHVWVHEDGENVQRAAIQINWTDRTARCIAPGCTGHWDRDHIDLLARVLEQDVDESRMADQ